MLFIGLDLAWSTKNGSGIAIIDADKKSGSVVKCGIVYSDQEILEYIESNVGQKDAFIAIDAPLIVPNMTGRRVAEEIVGGLFRRYNAGAHPANRERLGSWSNGKIRGEDLSTLLKGRGFAHSPYIDRYETTRKFFEVYPHPSMVVLFGLNKIIQYKAKPNRDYKFRYNAFKEYQKHLSGLSKAVPKLKIPNDIVGKSVTDLKAQKLKDYEDMLDSIFCAYIAYYCWTFPNKCAVLGDMENGYILTPITDQMRRQLTVSESQTKLKTF
ncbi:MAG: DUF429 domain-containing protein [Candidatus Marsarchaeota archaeon]|nr:DUF429 domain-containing protein [Candidatus Marsarchaeota archaeon]